MKGVLNSGVYSVLFQGWDICANEIISLGMSLKIGDARKGHFSWIVAFIFCCCGNKLLQSRIFSSDLLYLTWKYILGDASLRTDKLAYFYLASKFYIVM